MSTPVAEIKARVRPGAVFVADDVEQEAGFLRVQGRWRKGWGLRRAEWFTYDAPSAHSWPVREIVQITWLAGGPS